MEILIFIIIIIIVIIIIMNKAKHDTLKQSSTQEAKIKMRLYQEIDNITTECFDAVTTEFNSVPYFENRDIYLHSKYPDVIQYMSSNLEYIGKLQITTLNAILKTSDPDAALLELHKREKIIRNLRWVCGGGEDNNCPTYIEKYRNDLYDFIRGEVPCTRENLKKVVNDFEIESKINMEAK